MYHYTLLENYIMPLIGVIFILDYVLTVYPMYIMYKRANLKKPWLAFIPIIGGFKELNLANLSMWWLVPLGLLTLVTTKSSLALFVFSLSVTFKVCANFGMGVGGSILAIFFRVFVYWYIVLTNKPFIGEIKPKFTNN